jgi:hypothetical protein
MTKRIMAVRSPFGKGKYMHKSLALLVGLAICSAAKAQTITDPDDIVQQLQLWTQTDADPVYYGEMMDERGNHMACLELAFIKYENSVLHYIHNVGKAQWQLRVYGPVEPQSRQQSYLRC